jgi:hypothetical protein
MLAPSQERLNGTQLSILRLLHAYFQFKKVKWAYIDQKWMMEKMEKWYGYKVPRDTLSKNLAKLRRLGYIDSEKRHIRGSNGEFVPRVSLHRFTYKLKELFSKFANYFKRCGWNASRKAYDEGKKEPCTGSSLTASQSFRGGSNRDIRFSDERDFSTVGDVLSALR